MPKRTVTTIAHAALTDHRVAVGPDELLPEDVFEAGADPESGLLLLTETRRGEKSKIPGTVLLQAYASVIHDGHNEFRQRMNELLDKLARDSPKDPLVLSALARRAMLQNTPNSSQEAIRDFTSAIMNGSVTYEDSLLLAELYARQHQSKEAIQVLQKAMPANPYVREFPESLAAQYIMLGDYRNALQVVRKALETFPDDETLRLLEKKAKSETLE